MTIRVGHIGFLNCHPLYFGLERRGTLARGGLNIHQGGVQLELIPGVPTELNRMLVEGSIDIGPVSSIAYARNHRRLLVSRRLSISSFGAVDSIQLVSRLPLQRIKSVALSTQSATSVTLLKTILKLRYRRDVAYSDLLSPPEEALRRVDAALVIGDQGLEALHFPVANATCYDLGEEWQDWTGLPMVYAVWAVREEFPRTNAAELLAVEDELARCMDYGREHHSEVVESAVGRSCFDRRDLARYFAVLRYDFPALYQDGLRRFYELAYQAGELDEAPQLRFIDEGVGT